MLAYLRAEAESQWRAGAAVNTAVDTAASAAERPRPAEFVPGPATYYRSALRCASCASMLRPSALRLPAAAYSGGVRVSVAVPNRS